MELLLFEQWQILSEYAAIRDQYYDIEKCLLSDI